jgi:hypothetical protein
LKKNRCNFKTAAVFVTKNLQISGFLEVSLMLKIVSKSASKSNPLEQSKLFGLEQLWLNCSVI